MATVRSNFSAHMVIEAGVVERARLERQINRANQKARGHGVRYATKPTMLRAFLQLLGF